MILDQILEYKTQEVAAARSRLSESALRARMGDLPATRGFADTLRRRAAVGTAIIAEVKKGSPSKGIIGEDFDPVEIALRYERGGAACLSVLTDSKFFLGELSYLEKIRKAVEIPLLRKDFIIDPYQIFEARAFGADAILLIAAALEAAALRDLAALAKDLGMDVLLEVHSEEELKAVSEVPTDMVGINNRDLRTFQTDLQTTVRLAPMVSPGRVVVAESGIDTRADIDRLQKAGAGAFLVGESLMREKDFEKKLLELMKPAPVGVG